MTTDGGRLDVAITGDESWFGEFQLPDTAARVQTGSYVGLGRYPNHDPALGGLYWRGGGRGCNTATGSIIIDTANYRGDTLVELDLQFEQHCEGGAAALHGEIHWDLDDTTSPPGPDVTPPANLWKPADGVTPETGGYVYLESESGDYIGAGVEYLYTRTDTVISVGEIDGRIAVTVDGDESWTGSFQAMDFMNQVEAGYYGGLQRFPFHNPVKGGLNWSGEHRGCGTLDGWFVVDSITYEGGALETLDLRFEQTCAGFDAALHGQIHWEASENVEVPSPVVPPAGLWEPAPGATPASGNYIYLESDPEDYIGAGGTYLYTQADTLISLQATGALMEISVDGDEEWTAGFQGMYTVARFELGYYGDIERYPFQNPLKSGLSWLGENRGCGTVTGWFVVDSATYDDETLSAIDLRFEQRCEGAAAALHGKIHWDVNDPTVAAGPVVPPPAGLWEPAPGSTPATGTYVYFESEPGDYIGNGSTYLYTPDNSQIIVDSAVAILDVRIIIGADRWIGNFQGMNSLSRIEPGYYGNLERYPFHNPVRGGLAWAGLGRGCNELSGWVVVDDVTYDGDTLTAIDFRFEQHCEGGTPALHGEMHWEH